MNDEFDDLLTNGLHAADTSPTMMPDLGDIVRRHRRRKAGRVAIAGVAAASVALGAFALSQRTPLREEQSAADSTPSTCVEGEIRTIAGDVVLATPASLQAEPGQCVSATETPDATPSDILDGCDWPALAPPSTTSDNGDGAAPSVTDLVDTTGGVVRAVGACLENVAPPEGSCPDPSDSDSEQSTPPQPCASLPMPGSITIRCITEFNGAPVTTGASDPCTLFTVDSAPPADGSADGETLRRTVCASASSPLFLVHSGRLLAVAEGECLRGTDNRSRAYLFDCTVEDPPAPTAPTATEPSSTEAATATAPGSLAPTATEPSSTEAATSDAADAGWVGSTSCFAPPLTAGCEVVVLESAPATDEPNQPPSTAEPQQCDPMSPCDPAPTIPESADQPITSSCVVVHNVPMTPPSPPADTEPAVTEPDGTEATVAEGTTPVNDPSPAPVPTELPTATTP